MQKLTRETWARTLAEDLFRVLWLLWKAFLSFLMFEFTEMLMYLLLAWIHLRYKHTIIESTPEIEEDGSSS